MLKIIPEVVDEASIAASGIPQKELSAVEDDGGLMLGQDLSK